MTHACPASTCLRGDRQPPARPILCRLSPLRGAPFAAFTVRARGEGGPKSRASRAVRGGARSSHALGEVRALTNPQFRPTMSPDQFDRSIGTAQIVDGVISMVVSLS